MQEVIKLKLTEQAKAKNQSQVIMDTFIEACMQLDASIFEPLIDEDQLFQDLDKYLFLHSLKQLFDSVKAKELYDMELKLATCKGCEFGHVSHEFYSWGEFEFAFILSMKKGVLVDIFRCHYSEGGKESFASYMPF
jgi:hypothetical protein